MAMEDALHQLCEDSKNMARLDGAAKLVETCRNCTDDPEFFERLKRIKDELTVEYDRLKQKNCQAFQRLAEKQCPP